MYKNRARIEHSHNDNTSDEDFEMGDVPIPVVQRKPHAVSEDFRVQVKLSLHSSPFLSYMRGSSVTIAGSSEGPRSQRLHLLLLSHPLLSSLPLLSVRSAHHRECLRSQTICLPLRWDSTMPMIL